MKFGFNCKKTNFFKFGFNFVQIYMKFGFNFLQI